LKEFIVQEIMDYSPKKLTVEEVATRLGIKPLAVRRRVKKGTLKGKRQPGGRRIWFDEKYIDDLTR